MECRFYVGQKVVCIDAEVKTLGDPRFTHDLDGLEQGQTYTIRALETPPITWVRAYPHMANSIWVHLVEIQRRIEPWGTAVPGIEVGFRHTRFRPATDISSLEALLRGAKLPSDLVEA